jgi:hypothetical protein
VEVIDNSAAQSGGQSYSITATPVASDLASCAPLGMFETGVTASLVLAASDCPGTAPPTKSDRFYTWALTGQTITVTMGSAAFHPVVRVLSGQTLAAGTVLAADLNSGDGASAQVSYSNLGPPANFTIEATTTLAGGTGPYTLGFELAPGVYNAPVPVSGLNARPAATSRNDAARGTSRTRPRPSASARTR